MMDISIWCMAAIIPVTSWFICVIWFMRACTCIIALWLLATLSGIFPLVTACMNWSGDIASRLCRSAGVAELEALEAPDDVLLVAAGVLVLAVSVELLVALLPPPAVPAAAGVLVLVAAVVVVVVDAAGVALDVAPLVGGDAMISGLAEPVRFASNCALVSP